MVWVAGNLKDHPVPKTTVVKSQSFWVVGFCSLPHTSTLSKAGLARQLYLLQAEDPDNSPAETTAAIGVRGYGQGRGTHVLDVIEA